MVERPQLKASDRSMTAHSASPRATPPFPFPREKLKKGYASFRAAGPPWNSGLVPWMSFRALPPLPFPREEMKKDYVPLFIGETSPSQIAPVWLRLDCPILPLFAGREWTTTNPGLR